MSKITQALKASVNNQAWNTDIDFFLFMLIAFILVPYIIVFCISFIGSINNRQFGRAFGGFSQMVVGGFGSLIHELENISIACLGGHYTRGVQLNTIYDYKNYHYIGPVDHGWVSHNIYQSLFDFFLAVLPVYITSLLLYGVQSLLGGDTFSVSHITAIKFSRLFTLKSDFFHGLFTAFSTSNFLYSIIYLIIVILVCSTAFFISRDEFSRIYSGMIPWIVLLAFLTIVICIAMWIPYAMPILWTVMSFSFYILGKIIAYLILTIIIFTIFAVINFGWRKSVNGASRVSNSIRKK